MVKEGSVNPTIEQALRRILDQKAQVATISGESEKRDSEITRIYDDQQRLRENLKALKGSAEEKALLQRYTKQLDDEETQLDALRKKKLDTEAEQQSANGALQQMVQGLQMDVIL